MTSKQKAESSVGCWRDVAGIPIEKPSAASDIGYGN